MRDVHRGTPILAGNGKPQFLFVNDCIDVKYVTRYVLLQQVKRLLITQAVDGGPALVGIVDFLYADGARHRARLQNEGRRTSLDELIKLGVIECLDELRHRQSCTPCA